MTSLAQITALASSERTRSLSNLTALHRVYQHPAGLNGQLRTYEPADDEGERLPGESAKVQIRVEEDILPALQQAMARMFDLQFTQDGANASARADVVVNGVVLIRDAPVTYLMWLEKTLFNLRTFVVKLPTLDPADNWTWDPNLGVHRSDKVQTARSKKVPRNHVKAEATDRHPAQVEIWHEDVRVGTWTTEKLSGAVPAGLIQLLDDRVAKLIDAVRVARTEANQLTVTDERASAAVFGFLLDGQLPAA